MQRSQQCPAATATSNTVTQAASVVSPSTASSVPSRAVPATTLLSQATVAMTSTSPSSTPALPSTPSAQATAAAAAVAKAKAAAAAAGATPPSFGSSVFPFAASTSPHASSSPHPPMSPSPTFSSSPSPLHFPPDSTENLDFANGVTRCVCGDRDDSKEGMMLQCETCMVWQHAICVGVTQKQIAKMEEYYCFPANHNIQILTKSNGFVEFEMLKYGEEVATYNVQTRELEYQIPTKYIKKEVRNEKMIRVKSAHNNDQIDMISTADHRWFIGNGNEKGVEFGKVIGSELEDRVGPRGMFYLKTSAEFGLRSNLSSIDVIPNLPCTQSLNLNSLVRFFLLF